jgi:lauroyl/myristoyl acyltransferase
MASKLREFRRRLAAKATRSVRVWGPRLSPRTIDRLESLLRFTGPKLPILSSLVAANLREAGLYSTGVHRAYFRQVALHLANALRVFRWADRPEQVAALAHEQVSLDESFDRLRSAAAGGQGAVLAPAHTCNYLLTLARINQEIPIRIYLRWSRDERKVAIKQEWCRAAGIGVLIEPPSVANPASRAMACVEALRAGQVLAMTPDIAQKDGEGVAVRFMDREVCLPSGPASIAMLAAAPLVPVYGRLREGRQELYAGEPIHVASRSRAEGGRRTALSEAMQRWTDGFEMFLRSSPELWYLWADSRWTRVFRRDRRYAR